MKKYITLDSLKQKNLSDILLFVMEKGETTRREIQTATGFSWGTVSNSVAILIEKGYVKESPCIKKEYSVGRKTTILTPCGDRVVGVGLDVNRTGLEGVIIGFDGSVKHSQTFDFTAKNQEDLIALIESVLTNLINLCKEKYAVKSIGISFQGELDGELGLSYTFPLIENWKPFNVKEYFGAKFNLPIFFDHDPKCMLYSIKNLNVLDALLIRADEGIGLAVMQNGKTLEDKNRLELGHTIFIENGEINKGKDLEFFASARGLSSMANATICQIKENEQNYLSAIESATKYLSVAIYNAYVLFCSKKIILTGQLLTIKSYEKALMQNLKNLLGEQLEIVVDLNLSASIGVALKALKHTVKEKI